MLKRRNKKKNITVEHRYPFIRYFPGRAYKYLQKEIKSWKENRVGNVFCSTQTIENGLELETHVKISGNVINSADYLFRFNLKERNLRNSFQSYRSGLVQFIAEMFDLHENNLQMDTDSVKDWKNESFHVSLLQFEEETPEDKYWVLKLKLNQVD